ncbi:MAG: hypothetical protein RMJ15_10200 [Nitrososphaerota archaeon]|nr:hypothetical protein [Candidatus Bathyarchaeota archaeon]MDW8024086.1 hypothetical protein [Nitrososphaerota archaeon]
MGERLKIFAFVAVLGFIAGVIADVTATYVIPALIALLPSLGVVTRYIISGLAGAFLTVVLVGIWAYFTKSPET